MSSERNIQAGGTAAEGISQPSLSHGVNNDDPIANARNEKRWNRLANIMKQFHDYFKSEFETVYELADGSYSTRGLSTKRYLAEAADMRQHLILHHTIEERHFFPVLAKRMPAFRNDDVHISSHHAIHEGLDKLGVLLEKWKADPSTYSPDDMRGCMDSWREVLFQHLDQEVADLSGENMRQYWTLEELDRILI